MQTTTVFIRDLEIVMSVGIYPEEKLTQQRVILSIEGTCAIDVRSDDIEQTVSYEDFVRIARDIAVIKHYNLLEVFCEDLASSLLKDKRLLSVNIRCKKPDIFKGNPKSAGIEITRSR